MTEHTYSVHAIEDGFVVQNAKVTANSHADAVRSVIADGWEFDGHADNLAAAVDGPLPRGLGDFERVLFTVAQISELGQ